MDKRLFTGEQARPLPHLWELLPSLFDRSEARITGCLTRALLTTATSNPRFQLLRSLPKTQIF